MLCFSPDSSGNPFYFSLKIKRLQRIVGGHILKNKCFCSKKKLRNLESQKLKNLKEMSYLEIKDLEISFPTPKGKYIAVKDINLSIKKGEIISIIGHSGCGKSTIMNAIGGMLTPAGGLVVLDNKNIKGPGPDRGI